MHIPVLHDVMTIIESKLATLMSGFCGFQNCIAISMREKAATGFRPL